MKYGYQAHQWYFLWDWSWYMTMMGTQLQDDGIRLLFVTSIDHSILLSGLFTKDEDSTRSQETLTDKLIFHGTIIKGYIPLYILCEIINWFNCIRISVDDQDQMPSIQVVTDHAYGMEQWSYYTIYSCTLWCLLLATFHATIAYEYKHKCMERAGVIWLWHSVQVTASRSSSLYASCVNSRRQTNMLKGVLRTIIGGWIIYIYISSVCQILSVLRWMNEWISHILSSSVDE